MDVLYPGKNMFTVNLKVLNSFTTKDTLPVKVISVLSKRIAKPQRKVANLAKKEKDADTNPVKRKVNTRNAKPRKDVRY